MKRITILMSAILCSAAISLPALAADRDRQNRRYQQSDRDRDRNLDKNYDYYDRDRHRDYEYRNPGHRPAGYARQPRGRYYSHPYSHGNRDYHYEGHWRSWEDWERYQRSHPDRYRHGDYYREEGHLFFRFCDPTSSACFFFSIGK